MPLSSDQCGTHCEDEGDPRAQLKELLTWWKQLGTDCAFKSKHLAAHFRCECILMNPSTRPVSLRCSYLSTAAPSLNTDAFGAQFHIQPMSGGSLPRTRKVFPIRELFPLPLPPTPSSPPPPSTSHPSSHFGSQVMPTMFKNTILFCVHTHSL